MEIEVEEKEEEEKEEEDEVVVFRRAWDCGSSLYDSFELASVYRVLDNHLMALPGNGVMERGMSRSTAPAKAKGWRRRKAAAALAARRKGKAVLRSIFRSVTCSRRL